MRLIDADALREKAEVIIDEDYDDYVVVYAEDVDNAPTIDAVEVVRCKDCIHWYDREEVCLKIYSDGAVHESCWQTRKPDDFCSYGERREDDG